MDAGWDHACALSRGLATCWGRHANQRASAPTNVKFAAIGAGAEHSCGLTIAGDLRCWGRNDDGRATSRPGPFLAMAVGIAHTCVLRNDRTAQCQGDNESGQTDAPNSAFAQITAGSDHTCGLLLTGAVECWGSKDGKTRKIQFGPRGRFLSISAGWNTTCGVTDKGHAKCWSSAYYIRPPDPYDQLNFAGVLTAATTERPTDIFPWPSGGLAILDQRGYLDLYFEDYKSRRILDLTDKTDSPRGERGVLTAAVDPEFAEFPYLYVYYTAKIQNDKTRGRLARYPIVDGRASLEDELVILDIERSTESDIHWGGQIRFGKDGMLYLGVGDSTCLQCPQSLDNLHGKIIRIDVRGASVDRPYRVPEDNPFVAIPDARPEIWAYGLRNPWRMAFDPLGERLWIGDVGNDAEEEVSIAVAGANLGWPVFEGSKCFTASGSAADQQGVNTTTKACNELENHTAPVVSYDRTEGNCAVVGGIVYTGASIPWLHGAYLFGDYCSGRVWALDGDQDSGWQMIQIADLDRLVSSFGTDSAGDVLVLTFDGPILRLVETKADFSPSATHVTSVTRVVVPLETDPDSTPGAL